MSDALCRAPSMIAPAPGAEDREQFQGVAKTAAATTRPGRWILASALVALVSAGAFLPVLHNGFVKWDDQQNFIENLGYRGLGPENLRWDWTAFQLGVYQPLAWMILGAQYLACGLDPHGYHRTSLLLHAANAVLLLALTRALLARVDRDDAAADGGRGALPWAAALAVALYAVHPLRVEVVAWASCQPYLPCALFSLLAVLTYLRACAGRPGPGRVGWLSAVWVLYLAALLCKAAAAPLPVVLLILDAYPLRRWHTPGSRSVWREKLPFFALMLVFMAIAIQAKAYVANVRPIFHSSISSRLAQACQGICFYAVKTVAPFGLRAYHPMRKHLSLGDVDSLLSLAAVVGVSAAVYRLRRRWPGLLAAWACSLAFLAPNLGLIRVGDFLVAERYSYLAQMSGVVVLAYSLNRLARWPRRWLLATGLGLGLITALSALSWLQCLTWRTTGALWIQAFQHGESENPLVLINLGVEWKEAGRLAAARECFRHALKYDPSSDRAYANLGSIAYEEGKFDEAGAMYHKAVELNPRSAPALTGLGNLARRENRLEEAVHWYRRSLRNNPGDTLTHQELGVVLTRLGEAREALFQFEQAVRLNPHNVAARTGLACALAEAGRIEESLAQFAEAIRLAPNYANAHMGMGLVLSRRGRYREAAAQYEAALRVQPDLLAAHEALAELRAMQDRRERSH